MSSRTLTTDPPATARRRPRVLVLSRNYPTNVLPLLGIWAAGMVRAAAPFCDQKVIAPVPYCPPLPFLPANFARFREAERHRTEDGIDVHHPRFFTGPGYSTYGIESSFYERAVRRVADRLRAEFPFDLIHAHFTYPDGVAAVRLGRRYGVPVVITEQNVWRDALNERPGVRDKSIDAVRSCARLIAVSDYVRESIERFTGKLGDAVVIPNCVDGSVFRIADNGSARAGDQILFAGAIRPVKGLDVLIDALRILTNRGRSLRLTIAGEPFYGPYQQEEARIRQLIDDHRLSDRVAFVGRKTQIELAALMQQSAMLVSPSRSESLGMVVMEALACGTPVVATRSGGPQEILREETGVLVETENPEALARGIEHVLQHADRYRPAALRAYVLSRFGADVAGARIAELYSQVLRSGSHESAPREERAHAR